MHAASFLLLACAALVRSQLIDKAVANQPGPVLVSAPFRVDKDTPELPAASPVKPITTDNALHCQAFNLYAERDPTKDANAMKCPDPPSTTNYRCVLWGAPVSAGQATDDGQYRVNFHVVVTASNAFNKAAPPPSINGYSSPTSLGGSINAPGYMGYQYFPFSQSQGYNAQTCADACTSQTSYNRQHPAADGTYTTCLFFDAYVLSKNGIPQGLYCSMYNQAWGSSYATNTDQNINNDRYTISRSYGYSLGG